MSDEPIIEVRNLKYTFPNGTMALNGIDVDISRGEFIGIIGQNGSGKTTLVKNLSGLLTPPAGAIRVNGKDVTTITQGSLSTIVGYVFQNPDYMLYNMSVRDEVAAGPKNIGLPSEEIEKRIQMALTHVNLLNRKDLYPFHLPVGEKQRVGIASILVMKPSVIIVDEPTTGQDVRQSYVIMELLKKLNNEEGKTVIIITHDMRMVAEYARRAIFMSRGKILLDDETGNVFTRTKILEEAFVRPPQITQLAQRTTSYGFSAGVLSVKQMYENLASLCEKKDR